MIGVLPVEMKSIPGGIARQLKRVRKRVGQRLLRPDRAQVKTPVFIVGCQRSGTKMTLETLDRSPLTWTHDHRKVDTVYFFKHDPAYVKAPSGSLARLQAPAVIRTLIEESPAPVVAFHCIAESQHADRLLDQHANAKALWIYRRYQDVANSALVLWDDHQKDLIRRVHAGAWDRLKWRGERLNPEVVEKVAALYTDDMTPHEGAALVWYLRNQFYFDLGLHLDERVRLVKYEDVVREPRKYFREVFDFLNLPFEDDYVAHIFASSIGKKPFPAIDPGVKRLCDGLMARLEEHWE